MNTNLFGMRAYNKNMVTHTTQGVKISVEAYYQNDYSTPINWEFMFAYRITIENNSPYTVKLLKRHWNIFDSIGEFKEVEGVGVVGKQPTLKPGEQHQYVSGCSLKSEMGKMSGDYLMQRLEDGKMFKVIIPEFKLIAPLKMN
ncbi:MAG TPA: Co2+/Mg2+ efflux protein ApaG [Chitinophagales bacterium]|nr:Co2+/Mg2+ efflux protein ApaG [Chitinophagales bacterium]